MSKKKEEPVNNFNRIEGNHVLPSTRRAGQIAWFKKNEIRFQVDPKGVVFTNQHWLDGKDKYQTDIDDGFNLGAL